MDMTEVKRFDGQVGTLKLSEAIRVGARRSAPTSDIDVTAWIKEKDGRCFSCAVGAAFIGFTGRTKRTLAEMYVGMLSKQVASIAGCDYALLKDCQDKYEHKGWSREQCADWLESQGY